MGLFLAVFAAPSVARADNPLRLILAGGDSGTAESGQGPEEGAVCVRGRLTDEGVECPALRSEGGELYTLAGETAPFEVGDEVCVCGIVAEMSFCMQGTTIAVTEISPGAQGCPP